MPFHRPYHLKLSQTQPEHYTFLIVRLLCWFLIGTMLILFTVLAASAFLAINAHTNPRMEHLATESVIP